MALPWSFVSKITNSKHPAKKTAGRQIPRKFQTTSTPPKRRRAGKSKENSKVCYFEFRLRAAQALAPRVVIYL
jgi:hypothetical protein